MTKIVREIKKKCRDSNPAVLGVANGPSKTLGLAKF